MHAAVPSLTVDEVTTLRTDTNARVMLIIFIQIASREVK